MSEPECPLCRTVLEPDDDALLLAASPGGIALLHPDWAVRGHAMVVAPDHVENLSQLTDTTQRRFIELYTRTERALLTVLGVERVVMMKLGLAVPHLHWHLYPVPASRQRSEVFAAIAGETRDEPPGAEKQRLLADLRAAMR